MRNSASKTAEPPIQKGANPKFLGEPLTKSLIGKGPVRLPRVLAEIGHEQTNKMRLGDHERDRQLRRPPFAPHLCSLYGAACSKRAVVLVPEGVVVPRLSVVQLSGSEVHPERSKVWSM